MLHCCIGCTRRPWRQQQENNNAAAEAAALQAMEEESTRLAGEHKGGRVTSNFYLEQTVHFPVFVRLQVYLKRCAVLSLDSAVSFYTISTASCTVRTSRSRYLETRKHAELGDSSRKIIMLRRRPRHCKLCRKNRHDWQVNIRAGVLHPTFTSNEPFTFLSLYVFKCT